MFGIKHEETSKVDSTSRGFVTSVSAEERGLDGGRKAEQAQLKESKGKVDSVAGELLTRSEQEVH